MNLRANRNWRADARGDADIVCTYLTHIAASRYIHSRAKISSYITSCTRRI